MGIGFDIVGEASCGAVVGGDSEPDVGADLVDVGVVGAVSVGGVVLVSGSGSAGADDDLCDEMCEAVVFVVVGDECAGPGCTEAVEFGAVVIEVGDADGSSGLSFGGGVGDGFEDEVCDGEFDGCGGAAADDFEEEVDFAALVEGE